MHRDVAYLFAQAMLEKDDVATVQLARPFKVAQDTISAARLSGRRVEIQPELFVEEKRSQAHAIQARAIAAVPPPGKATVELIVGVHFTTVSKGMESNPPKFS
jgi:hypothetical protein